MKEGHISRTRTLVPLYFVVASLLALVLVPLWTQEQVERTRDELIGVLKPGRILVTEIQLTLAQEVSALRGYLISGKEIFLQRHSEAIDREDRAFTQLQKLSRQLGPNIQDQILAMHAAALGWRTPASELLNRQLDPKRYVASMPQHEALYEKALAAVTAVERELLRREEEQQAKIRDGERLQLVLTGALVVVALLAALVVAWLIAGLRLFAARAAAAVQARDEMLGIVSHDLRSPLNTVALSTSLLREPHLPDEQRLRQLEVIDRSTAQMNRLISDLLDVARIEAGQLAIEPKAQAAAPLVHGACEMLRPLATDRGLTLTFEVPDALPPVLADHERIAQIFANLVGNAVKLTPAGGRIHVQAHPDGREVRFSVADTGPGIPAEQQPHLFGRYWQARKTGRQGAGLGLFITRAIVEAHHGRIWVESHPGAGSTFHFTLPQAPPERKSG